jgi:hypothetical protein
MVEHLDRRTLGIDRRSFLFAGATTLAGLAMEAGRGDSPPDSPLRFLLTWGRREPGRFHTPHGLALDSKGCLYVVDAQNHRIQKFAV